MKSDQQHTNDDNALRFLSHLSPEMAFLVTIIDCSSHEEKKKKLDTFSNVKLDWMLFLKLAQKHHLTAFIGRKIDEHQIDLIPPAIKSAITSQTNSNNDRSDNLVNELVFLIGILKNEGIDTIAFKGPSLAINLYGDVKTRFSRDIDFLVKREDMQRALKTMEDMGYEFDKIRRSEKLEKAYLDYNGQYLMFSPESNIAVEPHSALGPSLLSIDVDYDELFNQTTEIIINHQNVKIFKPEALLIVLCLHGTKENWRRLKWILDIAQLLAQNSELDWNYIIKQSEKWGLRRSTLLGVKLAISIFNSTIPQNIQSLISKEKNISDLSNAIEASIEEPKIKEEESYSISWDYLRCRERVSDKFKYIYRTIFTPRDLHFGIVELPDALFFLYPVIKLVHDYLMLPPWLLIKKIFGIKPNPQATD